MRHRSSSHCRSNFLLLAGALALAACGGGGGDPSAPSSVQVLLSDGDTLPGGFVVNTIESANMADDRTVALIASEPGSPVLNGVFLRSPGGDMTPILTPASAPPGLALTVVRNLAMSGVGDVSFEVGAAIDDDAVFLYSAGQLSLVAQTGDQSTPPGFRLLGERRIANGGAIAFAYGISPCTIDTSGDRQRITCEFHLREGSPAGLQEVALPNDLASETTSSVGITMNDAGLTLVSLPASGRQSLVGQLVGGRYQSLLARGQSVAGFGTLLSAKPRAVGSSGAVVIAARFDSNGDGSIDQDRVLRLSGGALEGIAQTGVPAGTKQVIAVRGNGIDDRGRVVYTAIFGNPGDATGLQSLHIWDNGADREIAFEGQPFGQDDEGNDVQILEIEQLRVAGNGDVAFLVTIGFLEGGTRHVTDSRILRWADGELKTLLGTNTRGPTGTFVELSIADMNEHGDLLVIAGVNRRSERALVLVPRS